MGSRAYVGNIPFSYSKEDLEALFREFGTVRSVRVVADRETGRPRGFAFVEMDSAAELAAAMAGLNGREVEGRSLTVTEAREREARPPAGARPPPRGVTDGRAPQGPPREGSAPRQAGAPARGDFDSGPPRGRPEREVDRGSRRRGPKDDYDRHDKSWLRDRDDA